jgi:hypothetical protein
MSSIRTPLFLLPMAAAVAVALVAAPAGATASSAEDSAYCRKVRAQADSDAALLKWPRAVVDGLRFPSSNRIDLGPTVGNNFQTRIGLAFSPIDFYRGVLVERTGQADCEEHETAIHLEEMLTQVVDGPRLSALRAQAAFLEAHRAEWRALVGKAMERFQVRVITGVELHEVRRLADAVERKVEEVRGEAERLEAREPESPASLTALSDEYLKRADALDSAVARARAVDGWTFKVTGGVIPLPGQNNIDWYGLAELSYGLGDVVRARAIRRALDARADEVRHAPYALPARLARVQREAEAILNQARRELKVVEAELSEANATGQLLENAEAPGAAHARDTLALERLTTEADRVFLRALVDALSSTLGGAHGS